MVRQERNKDPKADHSKEEVQQPGHNLEWVRRPTPPIPTGPLAVQLWGRSAGLCRCCPHTLLRGCLVGRLVADVHLQREKEYSISQRKSRWEPRVPCLQTDLAGKTGRDVKPPPNHTAGEPGVLAQQRQAVRRGW